jgi:uncharacterized protein (TIGR03435 family)
MKIPVASEAAQTTRCGALRLLALLLTLISLLNGQTPAWKEFSIGPPKHNQQMSANLLQGVLHASSISLKSLIGIAAHLPVVRITGPDWMETEHYAVVAMLSGESLTRLRKRSDDARIAEEFRSLLTQELVRRFHLE